MKKAISVLVLFLPLFSFAQDCDCKSTFEWVKKTIEENDAGFEFVVNKKGKEVYEQHSQIIAEKVTILKNPVDCANSIREWLGFFRSGHISFQQINQQPTETVKEPNDQEIIDGYRDWEKIEVDLNMFNTYLSQKEKHDFEGIWNFGSYTIGIKKEGDQYLGFVIEADGVYWTKGQIKFKIDKDLSATYYMKDHSAKKISSVNPLGNNYLEIGTVLLERIAPSIAPEPEFERYIKAISAEDPYFERINNKTVFLRIPRFWGPVKSKIDSVISVNKSTILASPNLIIDLRNNGGGSDRNYSELLPILYTNPIRVVGMEYLSTPLNNQRMLDFIHKSEYGFNQEEKEWAQKSYDTLSKYVGEFVNLDGQVVTETTFDTIFEKPKNIGIIINEGIGSTTEQFLLAAKQSKKVKLYGTTTSGVLDISNMYYLKSPCEEFELEYSLSKSMRIPEMTIDDIGIQPDYYIDKEIPKYEWINFVTEILDE